MKRKNNWPSKRRRTKGRWNNDFNNKGGSFAPKGDWGPGLSKPSKDTLDVPAWHRDRVRALELNNAWPEEKSWLAKNGTHLEHPADWGYGGGVGYGGGYGGFSAASPGYGSGYGGFGLKQVEPLDESGLQPAIPIASDLIGLKPPHALLPKPPLTQGPPEITPYQLMKWSNELKARGGGEPGIPRMRNMGTLDGNFDLCYEYNTPQGCHREGCKWRHDAYVDEVPKPETEEEKSKRDDAMLQYFQEIDQVTKALQVAPSPPSRPVQKAPQSNLLDEPMDVICNEPVNNEPVIKEPVNNEPLVAIQDKAIYVPPPIPPKFKSVVDEKPAPPRAPKAPRIIRAPANVVTISPATVPNVAPPKIAPDLAPEHEEVKLETTEKKDANKNSSSSEQKAKKATTKSSGKKKPITKGKCCLLCRRRFKSIEMLKKHIKESQLHRKNLKLKGIIQAL